MARQQQPNQRGYVPQQTQPPRQPQQPYYPPQQQPWSGQAFRGYQPQPPFSGRPQGYVMPPHPPTPSKANRKETKKNNIWVYIPVAILALVLIAGAISALSQGSRQPADPAVQAVAGQVPVTDPAMTAQPTTEDIRAKIEPYNTRFCPGIYVNGISLGGMTQQEARTAVREQVRQENSNWYVRLVFGERSKTITADRMNFTTDVEGVLSAAWSLGHTGDENQRYMDMLRLEQEPYSASTAQPTAGDTSAIDYDLALIKQDVDRAPQDATMSVGNPSDIDNPFTYTDEQDGLSLDTDALRQQLYQMVAVMQSGDLDITPFFQHIAPAVRKLDLMQKYKVRSTAITPISHTSDDDRNFNIQLAFNYINGKAIAPGETFSFNKTVGMRTTERYFREADEYVSGELERGIGGGVCQASTTIYQAAECALMKIGKRNNHSEKVSYTDYALDATVYLTKNRSKDFTFTNTSGSDIYIFGTVERNPKAKKKSAKRVRVVIYGEPLDTEYYLESQVVEEYDSTEKPKYVKDTNAEHLYKGDTPVLKEEARKGVKAEAYLVNKSTGRRVYLHTDDYPAKPATYWQGVVRR